ncbi:MAG: dicarboxylate/amino acid:cation symporter [Treponema sp.]|nr:dicarboxylate/amino acid:cation symporter [Treponema sp.]MCL2237217.1 dicarboxylate/amino acid:cation symporter [Treponema sp.]
MNREFFKKPLVVSIAAAIGILAGLTGANVLTGSDLENFSKVVFFPGKLFVVILQMIVIPIIFCAVASSIGKLIRAKKSGGLAWRMIYTFAVCMAVCAVGGIALGVIGQPGKGLGEEAQAVMGKIIPSSGNLEVTIGSENEKTQPDNAFDITMENIIPKDIFGVFVFCSILAMATGIAIGLLQEESALLLLNFFSSVMYAFRKLFNLAMYLLPFALICLLAGLIASLGAQIFSAMAKFIALFAVGSLIALIACTAVIYFRSGIVNPLKIFAALFEPIALSFASGNSMAALPSAINSLDTGMKYDSTTVNITLPLGMAICRYENIIYFSIAALFTAQIYGAALSPFHFLIVFFLAILTGIASAGMSGIVALPLLGIILKPLNLPLEAVLIVFMAIDPVIAPFRSFLACYINIAVATLIVKRNEEEVSAPANEKQMIVYVQEALDKPPILLRNEGEPDGIEIMYIKEIGKRWNRQVIFKDAAVMNPQEREWIKESADIIAGIITSDSFTDSGNFSLSQSWASVNMNGQKTPLYFILPAKNREAQEINSIIQTLWKENYLKFILTAAKAKES